MKVVFAITHSEQHTKLLKESDIKYHLMSYYEVAKQDGDCLRRYIKNGMFISARKSKRNKLDV
jgi:hypothetical protein